jgi:hypothetical protein
MRLEIKAHRSMLAFRAAIYPVHPVNPVKFLPFNGIVG